MLNAHQCCLFLYFPTPRDHPLTAPRLYHITSHCRRLFLFIQFQEHSITMAHPTGTSTRSLHADDVLNLVSDVAPPLHVATTFRYPRDPAVLVPAADAVHVCLYSFLSR